MLKALAQQERQATRSRHRDAHAGPRDDLDIEMEALLTKQQRSHPEYVHARDHPAVVDILAHPLPNGSITSVHAGGSGCWLAVLSMPLYLFDLAYVRHGVPLE